MLKKREGHNVLDLYYKKHIFVCTNQKDPGKACCANTGGEAYFKYLKDQLLKKGLHGPGLFRVSKSKCLGRCNSGPCIVIYPEGTWYTYSSFADLDSIINQHLIAGLRVEHLLMQSPSDLPR